MPRRRGAALITAIFFVLVLFFMATALTANVHREMWLTKSGASQVEREYLALGALNEAIALLGEGESWQKHGPDSPYKFRQDDLVMEAWFVQDEEHSTKIHALARVYPKGQPKRAVWKTRVVRRGKRIDGAVYSLHFGQKSDEIPSVLTRPIGGGDWQLLPNPGGALVMGMGAGVNELYAVTVQVPMFRNVLVNTLQGAAKGREQFLNWGLVFPTISTGVPEVQKYMDSRLNWKLARYDQTTESWRDLLAFDKEEVGGVPFPTKDGVYIPSYKKGHKTKLYWVSNSGLEKKQLPAPPQKVFNFKGQLVNGKEGGITGVSGGESSLFAQMTYYEGTAFYKKTGKGDWERLPPVPRTAYTGDKVFERDGAAVAVMFAGVTPNDEPVVVWRASAEELIKTAGHGKMTRSDGLMIFRDGAWELLPPPPAGRYNKKGDFVPTGGRETRYQAASVDPDGRIVVSHHHDGTDVNNYLEDGVWTALPPVPRLYNNRSNQPSGTDDRFQDHVMGLSAGGTGKTDLPDRYIPISTY